MANGLTTKQEAFVLAYIGEARFNATKAATIAGYGKPGMEGSRLLKNDEIRARIKDFLEPRVISAEAVLNELADIATADWREFVTIKTNPKTGESVDVSMDLGSKVKSLEILAKAHGLLTDRIDLNANVTATVELVGVDPGDV